MCSGMARVRGITVLSATHTFIHEWNELSCLYSVSITRWRHPTWPKRGSARPITAHYSFIDLERMKGWVDLVGWRCSGRFTHISGHPTAAGRAYDRESSPVSDRRSTTVPRNQPAWNDQDAICAWTLRTGQSIRKYFRLFNNFRLVSMNIRVKR